MQPFENGAPVESVDFDYGAIDERDRGNPLEAELTGGKASKDESIIARLFSMQLTYGGVNSQQMFITANVMAFAMGLHPNQGAGGVSIAAGLNMEKATWFRRVNQMRQIIKARGGILPKIAGEWSQKARQSIKNKTTQTHEQRINHCRTTGHKHITDRFSNAISKAGIGN